MGFFGLKTCQNLDPGSFSPLAAARGRRAPSLCRPPTPVPADTVLPPFVADPFSFRASFLFWPTCQRHSASRGFAAGSRRARGLGMRGSRLPEGSSFPPPSCSVVAV